MEFDKYLDRESTLKLSVNNICFWYIQQTDEKSKKVEYIDKGLIKTDVKCQIMIFFAQIK